jgi:hypothetical protein
MPLVPRRKNMNKGLRCMSLKTLAVAVGLVAVVLLAPPDAKALEFVLDEVFNGTAPTSPSPYLTATFVSVEADTVELILTANLETSSEFVSSFAFNVDPAIDPSDLMITPFGANVADTTSIDATNQNAQNLPGGGVQGQGFDVFIDLSNVPGERLDNSTTIGYRLILEGLSLTDLSFNFENPSELGLPFAAHILGIPVGTGSGAVSTVGVPEPSTVLLFITGGVSLLGCGWLRQRMA